MATVAAQSISGLASGLDTSSIVTQLMQVEAVPQVRLQQRQAVEQVRQQALTDVKTRLANLQTQIAGLRDVATWSDTQTVDSSDATKLTATRTAGAAAGAFQVTVTDLARADQYKGATLTTTSNAGPLTIAVGAKSISVDVTAGGSLDTLATAINGSTGTPVYASVVNAQLVLSSRTTGAANTISIGGNAAVTTELGLTRSITAADAHYRMDGVDKTSSTNTVADALPGVQLVLKAVTSSAVTVSVGAPAPSTSAIQGKIQSFVDQYNSTIEFVQSKIDERKVASPKNAADRAKGVLSGDASLTGLLSSLRTSVADLFSGRPASARSLSQVGLSTGSAVASGTINKEALSGKLTLDSAKLATALTTSLGDVKALFTNPTSAYSTQGLAQRFDTLLTAQLKTGGAMASRLASSNTQISQYTKSIGDWSTRLATRQAALQRQFTAMETALSNAQSQGSWISGQISRM